MIALSKLIIAILIYKNKYNFYMLHPPVITFKLAKTLFFDILVQIINY